jgi:F0F1-type ATP synthase delta subunit
MATSASRRLIVKSLGDMLAAGASARKIGQILAAYLVENRLVRDRALFVRDLRREIEQRFGVTSVEVRSASRLSAAIERQIETFVRQQTGAKQIEIMNSVDESLIAGVVISTTDYELDGSLKSRIKELRNV